MPTRSHPPEHDQGVIADSHLFDAAWYLDTYPDVAAAGIDPLLHYVLHGAAEERDPSEFFSTGFYLRSNPDVATAAFNPLVHYALHGREEGRPALPASKPNGFAPYRFEGLMRSGLAEVARQMALEATPAERLARDAPDLYSPTLSILMPVFDTPERFLREAVQSIRAQTYTRWELCIVDDASTRPETLAVLEELRSDPRILQHRMAQNGGIAKGSDAALALATGDYVAFVDHDDLLTPNALSEVVGLLRQDRDLDYVYSDHVQADPDGLPRAWARKPSWSPEFLLSTNYVVHFKVVRRELLMSLGGIAQERSQVQDLAMSLRLARAEARVAHLPLGLYLWREHKGSVAASTTAKPGIEGLLVETYTEHVQLMGSAAHAIWPASFRGSRTGAFRLSFPEPRARTALVRFVTAGTGDAGADDGWPAAEGVEVHRVAAARHAAEGVTALPDDAAVRAFFASLAADHVVLMAHGGRVISPQGISALTGYLDLSPDVGAAGGKVLNAHLQVVAGGFLLSRRGDHGLICGGEFDNAAGHWLVGQVASNVDGLSARCLAVRRTDLVDGPGLKPHEWDEFAGVVLCQDLRATGRRIVYNPAVKVLDVEPVRVRRLTATRLKQASLRHVPTRTFAEFHDIL